MWLYIGEIILSFVILCIEFCDYELLEIFLMYYFKFKFSFWYKIDFKKYLGV